MIADQASIDDANATIDALSCDITDAEKVEQRRREEQERLTKFKRLVKVSKRLPRADIGQYIGLEGKPLFALLPCIMIGFARSIRYRVKNNTPMTNYLKKLPPLHSYIHERDACPVARKWA